MTDKIDKGNYIIWIGIKYMWVKDIQLLSMRIARNFWAQGRFLQIWAQILDSSERQS